MRTWRFRLMEHVPRFTAGTNKATFGYLRVRTGTTTRFTSGPSADRNPVWSPDGNALCLRRIAADTTLVLKNANGAGEDELLFKSDQDNFPAVGPGRRLIFQSSDPKTQPTSFTGGSQAASIPSHQFSEAQPCYLRMDAGSRIHRLNREDQKSMWAFPALQCLGGRNRLQSREKAAALAAMAKACFTLRTSE
jgi:hypothetical protein